MAAGAVRIGADALDVVVVAHLGRAEIALVADDLLAVLAELAVHAVVALGNLGDPREEGVHHQRMVVEIGGLAEGDLGVGAGGLVHRVVDAPHQHAGEEEVGEDHDAPEAEARDPLRVPGPPGAW